MTTPSEPDNQVNDRTPPRMKVAHVITRLIIGGAQENTLFNVEDQLRDYGDDVTLITGPGLGPEGSLEDRAIAAGIDMRIIPEFRRNIHPWRDVVSHRALVRLLREIQPQVVHTHASKAGIMGRYAAHQLGIPAVHTIHGASFHTGQSRLAHSAYQFAEKCAARRCQKFISVCDAMTDQYVAAGIAPREKFTTIYSGFEVDQFLNSASSRDRVRQEFGLGPNEVVVGKVARLFPLKGHEFLIAAAPRVVAACPNVRFLLVGDGILRADFEQRIADAGLSKHFVFAGLVPPTRIPEMISAMDIVAHTSQWEGLARVLPQALISGKPVVSYDIDGAKEVVLPGITGYLLTRDSIEPLAAALIELAQDENLRTRLGRTGRGRFADQFRHETMTRRIREVYWSVIGGNG